MNLKQEMLGRTKKFAIAIITLARKLPRTRECDLIGRQFFRSGTSVGANYRAASRAKSKADFINKIAIVEEEADETLYWLELISETGIVNKNELQLLMQETNELVSIMVATLKTAKNH